MTSFKFEYIWLDGTKPESTLRSKTKIKRMDSFNGDVSTLGEWSFDGSSTNQAEGSFSDCLLRPVSIFPDPEVLNGYLVMCEVFNADGTPHATNHRNNLSDDVQYWFGMEQEYVIMTDGKPIGFPKEGYPEPQGPYYCGVGNGRVEGRDFVMEHMEICLEAGLDITGINAEVMLGQWEYQLLGKGAQQTSDELWISRYLLYRLSERYGVTIDISPKPVKGDWNGSGMHANFSNDGMRKVGGKEMFISICEAFGKNHNKHIAVYGSNNDQRLTGAHETQSIDEFSYGISDRGASIRIPVTTAQDWIGYLEDRRPASNANPYLVTGMIINTMEEALVTI